MSSFFNAESLICPKNLAVLIDKIRLFLALSIETSSAEFPSNRKVKTLLENTHATLEEINRFHDWGIYYSPTKDYFPEPLPGSSLSLEWRSAIERVDFSDFGWWLSTTEILRASILELRQCKAEITGV